MLKPEKWQSAFDNEGKVAGFQKAPKLIILGGVDPSIRPEVWEFLLGCYTLGSTSDYRRQLRTARRSTPECYNDLIKQCQTMHSSIGTGSLAYTVGSKVTDMRTSSKDGGKKEATDNFQIKNNADLIMESNVSSSLSKNISCPCNSEIELVHPDAYEPVLSSNNVSYKTERMNDVRKTTLVHATRSQEWAAHDERVSEWLWILHQIVVDVVRTDSHLEFYEDTRNLAIMSDILAVYAWVDPASGYCHGMSDLLSPFVVIFEDNADAFWCCFEMLIRRMRENFQMEGPTGVMKQLQALWHILKLSSKEIFAHLSNIGAESLHFAFPMLLVLFRRELSFSEALRMWEMMWAADFEESFTCNLEEICLEALVVQLPRDSGAEIREENPEKGNDGVKDGLQLKHSFSENKGIKVASTYHFCGLTQNFWSRNDRLQICCVVSSARKGDDDFPVFCVAAILIMNRQKIIRETCSIDDMIMPIKNKGHSAQNSE
ncbi:hypothetical protein DITRI_Ditri15bG0028100 [Diplodiscus trichospermus]